MNKAKTDKEGVEQLSRKRRKTDKKRVKKREREGRETVRTV